MHRFTGYPHNRNPTFSRSGRRDTTNSTYGAHLKPQYTESYLKKSWENTPVRRPPNNSRPLSRGGRSITDMRSVNKPKEVGKSGIQGTTSKAPGHQSAGVVTTGTHSVTASSNNKTTPYGSHSLATSKDNKNAHQPTGIIKPSVREDHMSNKLDQSKHQSPVSTNKRTISFVSDTITTTTTTAAAATTSITTAIATTTSSLSKPSNAIGEKSSTSGVGNLKGTSHPHKSNTSIDDVGKSDVRSSISNSTGKHQSHSVSTSQSGDAIKQLTGVGTHSNSSVKDDRPSHHSTTTHKPSGSSDFSYGSVKKPTNSNGNGVMGSRYNQYTRNIDAGVGRLSYSTKQTVRGLSNLGNTCFYNAVMQNLTVLVILHERLKQLVNSENRSYTIPGGDLDAGPLTVTVNTSSDYNSLTSKLCQFLTNYKAGNPNPGSVLDSIGNKNTRFRGRSQQDSHELFRALLDGIRTEEAELIRKAIDQKLGVSPMDGETKLMKKVYRRNIITQIDEVFGGKTCSIVVCRKCHHVSETIEPFLDLSLPIVDSQRGGSRHMKRSTMNELTTTFSGVCELLERQQEGVNTAYPMVRERSHDGSYSIENCLSDYTDLEVLDEDNMFICTECNRRHQEKAQPTGKGSNEPVLSPVSKLLLINKLPPVLVLHLKRFNLGYTVTKNSKHVNFSLKLNMKKYCTKLCEGGYDYRLKGVVSHSGSLNFGHYIAYVCTDNQWYYASDSSVSTATDNRVLNCEAYMLFYERTP